MAKIFTITEGLENMGALRSGGQGSVYKGRRVGPIITAVKLLPTPIHSESADDKNYRNFKNEVEKLKQVNLEPNPNVVKILNYGITESGSLPFIEMEYIEGPDLEELLQPPHAKIYLVKEAIKVADQLACALLHCHKAGVRHGDIKSNNVKFNTNTGNYVLLDFGLAVMSDEQRRSSLRNAGAIEFMAPEQNDGVMLFQTDIYSYGVILYELLAGQVPFPLFDGSETSRNMVRLAHMETPVPDLLEKRRLNMPDDWPEEKKAREMQMPDWLLSLIYKCLQKNPDDRYADGKELFEAFTQNQMPVSNVALLAENERLQMLLKQSQTQRPVNSGATSPVIIDAPEARTFGELLKLKVIPLPREIVIAFLIFFLLLLFYSVSAFFSPNGSPHQVVLSDTTASALNKPVQTPAKKYQYNSVPSDSLSINVDNPTLSESMQLRDSLKKDSIHKARLKKKARNTKKRKKSDLRRLFDKLF